MEKLIQYIKLARDLLLVGLLILLGIVLFDCWPRLVRILDNAADTSAAAKRASERIDRFVTPEVLRNFENNVNTSALTGQQVANDYGRVARSTTDLMDTFRIRLDKILTRAETVTMPRAEETLAAGTGALNKTTILLERADGAIVDFRALLTHQDLPRAITAVANTAEQVNEIAKQVGVTAAEVNKAVPELLTKVALVADNTAGATGGIARLTNEGADFIHGLNQPTTKKQKLFKALIVAASIAVPVLANR